MMLSMLLSLFLLGNHPADSPLIPFLQKYCAQHYAKQNFSQFLFADLEEQCMYHIRDWQIVEDYRISSAAAGVGSLSGSNQTPAGLHIIAEKHGDGLQIGAILKSRKATGEIARIYTDPVDVKEDHVTTRILWLKGLEPGVNQGTDDKGHVVDSYKRYIYIHGTPEEGLLGQPASHGCLRMANDEVMALYDQIAVGTPVLILEKRTP